MAVFTDRQGRYFLDTFRINKKSDAAIIGGLMEIPALKIATYEIALRILSVFSVFSSAVTLFFSINGWPENEIMQIIFVATAFSNFFLFFIISIIFTNSPVFITIKNKSIYLTKGPINIFVDLCIMLSSFSILMLFFSMFIYSSSSGFDLYFQLIIVTVVFLFYFLVNLYRLIFVSFL